MKTAIITKNAKYIDGQVNDCHKFNISTFEDSVLLDIMSYTDPKHVRDYVNEQKAKEVFVKLSEEPKRVAKSKLVEALSAI